jgi:hypothetical protein
LYSLYLPKNHPLIGINYFKIAKLELFLKYYENSEDNFKRAEKIIILTHGLDHKLYKDLRNLLQQCYLERQSRL